MSLLLRDLGDVADDEASFGGKAAGLGRLVRAGARVPAGFAVEARHAPWSEDERAEVRDGASALLRAGPLAVRSSAVGEDSAERSFAGLFESVLDVRSADEALDAAGRCLASRSGERVRAYTDELPAVGVVFQSLVDARAAGVCFTLDPDGRDAAVRIEAAPGRGDALVGGRVQPESWRVYEGARGWEARGPGRVLAAVEAAALAREARGLAHALGRPLDLEWAIGREGRVWWLQARPITAARPLRAWEIERFSADVDDGPVTLWANWNLREVVREPFAPLPWGIWRETILPLAVMPLFGLDPKDPLFQRMVPVDLVNGRLYWNMNALLAVPGFGALVPLLVGRMDARAGRAIARLRRSRVLTRRVLGGRQLALHARTVAAALRKAATTLSGESRPRRALRILEECGEALRSGRPDVARLGEAALLDELRLFARPETEPLRRGQQAMGAAFAVWIAAERAFRRHPDALRLLAAGTSANPTTAISCGVSALAEHARALGLPAGLFREPYAALREGLAVRDDGRAFLAGLDAFLDRFGHRCPHEFDLTAPRWRQDPTMILDLVRVDLESPPGETVEARLARLSAERERAIAAAVAASPAWRRPPMRFLARQVVACMPMREAPKHHAMLAFERIRAAALELGRRLTRRGALLDCADVMFLEWSELQALAAGGAPPTGLLDRVRERREALERRRAQRPPDLLRSDGVPEGEDEEEETSPPGTLRGLGASGGLARGPVRILRTPDAGLLRDGDVLVVEYADPGWTPLFPRAAALVMEVGGAMSHAAVVARELGIPAVFGVREATRALADGETVEVDGDRGLVTSRAAGPPAG
jgi:phosphohistidine swiveling domain-containing protein